LTKNKQKLHPQYSNKQARKILYKHIHPIFTHICTEILEDISTSLEDWKSRPFEPKTHLVYGISIVTNDPVEIAIWIFSSVPNYEQKNLNFSLQKASRFAFKKFKLLINKNKRSLIFLNANLVAFNHNTSKF
jgi:hypothetical protein